MLHRVNELTKYAVRASDGDVGHIDDVIFDDSTGSIRYIVVDTNDWLPGGKVLVPPVELAHADKNERIFATELTRDQVRDQPPVSFDRPLSRQMEDELHQHFGWQPYWVRGPLEGPVPGLFAEQMAAESKEGRPEVGRKEGTAVAEVEDKNPSLRSTDELIGYDVKSTNGTVGQLTDIVIDDRYWQLRYMIVETGNWLKSHKVLLSTGWIEDISWSESAVFVGMNREMIDDSPDFNPDQPIERQYEEMLYNYYGRRKYWIDRQ